MKSVLFFFLLIGLFVISGCIGSSDDDEKDNSGNKTTVGAECSNEGAMACQGTKLLICSNQSE